MKRTTLIKETIKVEHKTESRLTPHFLRLQEERKVIPTTTDHELQRFHNNSAHWKIVHVSIDNKDLVKWDGNLVVGVLLEVGCQDVDEIVQMRVCGTYLRSCRPFTWLCLITSISTTFANEITDLRRSLKKTYRKNTNTGKLFILINNTIQSLKLGKIFNRWNWPNFSIAQIGLILFAIPGKLSWFLSSAMQFAKSCLILINKNYNMFFR